MGRVDEEYIQRGNQGVKAETRLNNFKNSVRNSKTTPHFTITKINYLILFKEIIHVYTGIMQNP
jgi:hypothetical protein